MNHEAGRIAEEARKLDVPKRELFLSSTCGGNERLLEEVRALLGSDPTIAVDADRTVVDATPASMGGVPKKIGQFHIRRQIGVGGMGAVYEALQDSPRRRVAIKVLKASVANEASRKRFEYESQVLARLKHPGIAEIYEAGTYQNDSCSSCESGQCPYFAMEYIPGRKDLDTYAREKELGLDRKLNLFTQICEALHHGHQKGIVHRDLKPGNILVDGEGRPRIIDFGVARATDSDVALATMQTEVGQIIGTIEYMSPEQCEGDPELVDVRSDVYSLGVVLFELLTGERPRKLDGSSIYEAIKKIKENSPTRMGTIDRSLGGDLETVVSKAMEKDPDRRYQSALEFKQDIERYMASEPIEARPPSLAYQTKMFAKRHKGVAISVVIVALVLVVTTGWSLVERNRASRAAEAAIAAEQQAQLAAEKAQVAEAQATEDRDAALAAEAATALALARVEAEKSRTLQAMDFVTGILQLANPANAQGRKLGILEIFREASSQIEEVFAEEPAMAAELYTTIGELQLEIGDIDGAESSLVNAVVLAEREHGTSSLEALTAGVLNAAVMVEQGRYDEAGSRLDSILAATKILGEDARGVDLLARKWMLEVMGNQLRMAEAMELARVMVEDAREMFGPDHEKTVMYEVRYAHYMITTMRVSGQATPEDFELPYGSLERVRSIMGALHPITIEARFGEAMLLFPTAASGSQSQLGSKKMNELLVGIVADARLVLGDSHSHTLDAIFIQGLSELMGGDADTAVETITEAYDGYVENHSADHPMAHQIATMLGGTLLNLKRVEEAVPVLEASWRGEKKLWGEEDIRTLTAESTYALALLMLGEFEEGNIIFESAMLHHDLFPQAMLAESKFRMLLTKAKAELDFDRKEEAMATGQRLIRVAANLDEAGTRIRWAYPVEMIYGLINEGHIEDAATLSNELMIFLEKLLAEDPDASMSIRVSLGKKLMDAKALDAATSILEGGLNLVDIDDTAPMIAGRILMFAGLAAARSNRTEEATAFFEKGLGKLMGEPSENSQRIALIEAMARGEHAEARRLLAVARDVIDGAAQKAVYEGLIAEFPLQE